MVAWSEGLHGMWKGRTLSQERHSAEEVEEAVWKLKKKNILR